MANFTSEEAVRLKFRVEESDGATTALIEANIAHAHQGIVSRIRPEYIEAPPDAVIIAETLLAGAATLRSLSARLALDRRETRLAGHQIETGRRFPALMETAAAAEAEAARLLAPYGRHAAESGPIALLTETL